jgi:hypothetical protein
MLVSRLVLSACLKALSALCGLVVVLCAVWAVVHRLRDGAGNMLAVQLWLILGFGAAAWFCRWLAGRAAPEG